MLNDQARNDAFERAIAKAGAGAGLLLTSAPVGPAGDDAARVVACEASGLSRSASPPMEPRRQVAFWFDLQLDAAITLSTRPGGDSKHWRQPHLLRARPPGAARRGRCR